MNRYIGVGMTMLAGAALGGIALNGLHAQSKGPGAYAIIDLTEITDREDFMKQLLPKAGPAILSAGGKFLAATEKIVALDGTPPQRFVIIAFDSVDKAKAWDASPAQKEVNAMRVKWTKSRVFVVEGEGN